MKALRKVRDALFPHPVSEGWKPNRPVCEEEITINGTLHVCRERGEHYTHFCTGCPSNKVFRWAK